MTCNRYATTKVIIKKFIFIDLLIQFCLLFCIIIIIINIIIIITITEKNKNKEKESVMYMYMYQFLSQHDEH